jgi:multidrug resistance protein, MATE family
VPGLDSALAAVQGAGKQRYGAVINLVAFYVFGIPVGLALGFWGHLGVEGMYL